MSQEGDEEEEGEEGEEEEEGIEEDDEDDTEATLLYKEECEEIPRISTGDDGLDHVLNGGLPEAHVVGVAAQPGTGKSTLLRTSGAAMAHNGLRVLIACPEEGKKSLAASRDRLGLSKRYPKAAKRLWIVTSKKLENVLALIDKYEIDVFIFDSVNYAISDEHKVNAMVQITKALCRRAHATNEFADCKPCSMFLVYHATKAGKVTGNNTIVHAVDAFLWMEHLDPDTMIAADDQSKGTGVVGLRIHQKIRFGDMLAHTTYAMTSKGLVPYEEESEGARGQRAPRGRMPRRAATGGKKPRTVVTKRSRRPSPAAPRR